ncbi:pyridine nucleotide-disulfide oxidoreductase [Brevibacillus fluminis]|uniref:NADH:ubiquinone reductase (non-electrogenic) n=2 Tax=Brevibacillus fluminis TaxID=511487 RepID=A0A3M8DIS6_9BACL|nr:FAD-dependent oxidoreductase [Brevibacillus fluminis]RNB87275.1 pyridine nucleotide-disulfide oxidoreductase [Brevibacillus fluminis]
MKMNTCVVVGGGYAGINAVQAICKTMGERITDRTMRVILIDKEPHHLRKVLLFKPAAQEEKIALPLNQVVPSEVQVIQGTVAGLNGTERNLMYFDQAGGQQYLNYDFLVLALGSTVRCADPALGGIALNSLEAAESIREMWRANLKKAQHEKGKDERQRLMSLAVAGAGISGIETSAELAHAMREEASRLGLDPEFVKVYLVNAKHALFPEGPAKMGHKLERALQDLGVTVINGQKALRAHNNKVELSGGSAIHAGLCVWTLGLVPNPLLGSLGLPLSAKGQLIVDASYRVAGMKGVYSIGDCAHIVDPQSGRADMMTCKEAKGQAARLGKVMLADLQGKPAPVHKSYMDIFCIGLGPGKGMVWTRQCGVNIILEGKLGWKFRQMTWNIASLIK